MDLLNENFITADEEVEIWNDAVGDAAAEIQKLGVEDEYFKKQAPLQLVINQQRYGLPADIYAQKIRAIIYAFGVEIYTIYRVRRRGQQVKETEIQVYAQDAYYMYDLENPDSNTGYQLVLYPPSRENSNAVKGVGGLADVTMTYIREPIVIPLVSAGSQAASDAIKIDIPQFKTYIFAYVKARYAEKIPHPNLSEFLAREEQQKQKMIDALTEQVPDDATEVEPDFSHYWRHS